MFIWLCDFGILIKQNVRSSWKQKTVYNLHPLINPPHSCSLSCWLSPVLISPHSAVVDYQIVLLKCSALWKCQSAPLCSCVASHCSLSLLLGFGAPDKHADIQIRCSKSIRKMSISAWPHWSHELSHMCLSSRAEASTLQLSLCWMWGSL